MGLTGLLGHEKENIWKAHIRLDDEDTPMGPFGSGPLLLLVPLLQVPSILFGFHFFSGTLINMFNLVLEE